MKYLVLALVLVAPARVLAADASQPSPRALLLDVKGAIGPALADFVVGGIERAESSGARLVILRMDTPGGLDSSMREIIHKILASSVPVATYVAPSGSRAASAGTYILYASHIAAMAPATNLGAATPVQIGPGGVPGGGEKPAPSGEGKGAEKQGENGGSPMERKIVNDAVAYIRGLAKLRGRNAQWAEKAVREAASLTASDALAEGVIDVIAPNVRSLLERIDGRRVQVRGQEIVLHTKGLEVERLEPGWRTKLLAVIADPNVAYVLMLLGIYGLIFELANPGGILPGVLGGIALLLSLYALEVLPVNYAGLGLMLLGIAFMIGEAFVPSFGALGIGGLAAFVFGSLMLMDTDVPAYQLSLPLVLVVAAVTLGFFLTIMAMAVRQRRRPVATGRESLVGGVGEAVESFARRGRVRVGGEVWEARSATPVERGQPVRVRRLEGLVLEVEPLPKEE